MDCIKEYFCNLPYKELLNTGRTSHFHEESLQSVRYIHRLPKHLSQSICIAQNKKGEMHYQPMYLEVRIVGKENF